MTILLVSPYFIDSYAKNISMGSAVKLAFNLSKITGVLVLTSGRKKRVEKFNKSLKVISCPGLLIPDPINYMISFSLLIKFWQLLKKIKPDVVIVSKYMFFSSFVIPLARIKKIPVITVTDTFPGINWFSVSKLTSLIMWLYARTIGIPLLRMSNKIVLLHKDLEPIAEKYHLNFVTIHNGVEEKYFSKLPAPTDIKKPSNEFWVGFVGRQESAKGYKQALKIAKSLERHRKIKFIFIGGDMTPCVYKNKIYLGFRKDIMNIYQLLDVLILPSHAEGLPNVVMEAMAQDVPVIANNVGGVSEIIRNEENGILVKFGDCEAMKRGILKLHINKNLRRELGMRARKTIQKDFNWNKILTKYANLIGHYCGYEKNQLVIN